MMLECGDRCNCPDVTRGVAHTVPFTRGVRLSERELCGRWLLKAFFCIWSLLLGDTWRNNRMILDLDSRFYRGSVLELDDRIMEGSKT